MVDFVMTNSIGLFVQEKCYLVFSFNENFFQVLYSWLAEFFSLSSLNISHSLLACKASAEKPNDHPMVGGGSALLSDELLFSACVQYSLCP